MSSPGATERQRQEVFTADSTIFSVRASIWWKKYRLWFITVTLLLAMTAAGLVIGTSDGRSAGVLSINNPAPSGAQAAAAILRSRGVQVAPSDSLQATKDALAANGPGASTVLVFDPRSVLKGAQFEELAGAAAGAQARIVAIEPGPLSASNLSPEISSSGTKNAGSSPVPANCTNEDATTAGPLILSGTSGTSALSKDPKVRVYLGTQSCFSPGVSPTKSGVMVSNAAGDVTVLGSTTILSNDGLARGGNAALAFRLLGSKNHLIWYTPSLKDVPVAAKPPSLAELTPQWIFPASGWLFLVAIIGMFWRGRRHGPLVTEPLPVIVKASETVTGRARLYQNAKAVDTAARTLQRATLTRLARRLRLGTSAEPEAVVDAAVARTGRNRMDLSALLVENLPRNEQEMLTMAAQLAALEEEVAQ